MWWSIQPPPCPSNKSADILSVGIGGTKLLLEKAQEQNVDRFIYISSAAVYGVPDKLPCEETDEVNPYDPYNSAKIEAEKLCATFRDEGMCIPVFRPKSLLGPGRLGLFGILFEWAFEGHNFPMLGPGNFPYQFCDVRDLCRAVEMCMDADRDLVNDTFNIAANRYSSIREDFQSVLDAAGHGKRMVALPSSPAIVLLKTLDFLNLSPVYPRLYLKLIRGSYVDTRKAEQAFGFTAEYSNNEALVNSYRWYLQNRDRIRKRPGTTHTSLWRQGALRFGKAVF